ncbi:MAG: hypothetical protein IJ800_06635, partial [Clostridia bacterium]|nr:hypothetical protein [Clostridia bacterium]
EKVYEAVSSTIDSINSLIESFADDDDDETTEFENISYSARTVPTMSEEEEEETEDDIQKKVEEYKKNYIKLGGTGAANFEKAIARLKEMGVVDSSEKNYSTKDADSILAVSYFRNMIKSAIESEIVRLYEDGLKKTASINYVTETDAARKDEVFNALWNRYVDLQRSQQATYEGNIKDFETQLGNVSDTTFVVYDSEVGYTYVSHLVVRFDEQQTELVSAEQEKADATDSSVQAYVDELVKEIAVKDLRATWVQSGYGTYDGESFTFSKDYVYDTEGPLATYNGNIKSVTTYVDKDEDDNDQLHLQFHGVTPNEIGYDDFAALAGSVIGGENTVLSLGTVGKIAGYADDAKKINKTDFNKFEDLKFAFSDDEGNFNNYIGYLYSPITSSKKYVSAFTKACKEVSEAGVGAYQMFASKEYGLHVVLCTAKATYGVYDISDEGKAEFRRDLDEENKDSVAYLFMQANIDLVTDNYISDVAQGFIYSYTAEDSKQLAVTKYASVYSDLITE